MRHAPARIIARVRSFRFACTVSPQISAYSRPASRSRFMDVSSASGDWGAGGVRGGGEAPVDTGLDELISVGHRAVAVIVQNKHHDHPAILEAIVTAAGNTINVNRVAHEPNRPPCVGALHQPPTRLPARTLRHARR